MREKYLLTTIRIAVFVYLFVNGNPPVIAHETTSNSLYGVIEIGSSGVRAFLIDYDRAQNDGCRQDDEHYVECLNLQSLKEQDVTPIDSKAVQETTDAVLKQKTALSAHHQIRPDRIFIVGSSGISNVPHKDLLVRSITEQVMPSNPVEFISVDDESKYAFDSVLSMLPLQYRSERRRTAVIMDIGGGNTKGSYMEGDGDSARLIFIALPWGTKKATSEINGNMGNSTFLPTAETWRDNVFIPAIRGELDRKPGTINRGRVYLIGGLPWALVTLTMPENKDKFPIISMGHIDRLYQDVTASDAESRLCIRNKDNVQGSDVARVCKKFTMENLIAGLQILKGLVQEMKLDQPGKQIFFFRNSQFAWPIGYLRSKIEGDYNSP